MKILATEFPVIPQFTHAKLLAELRGWISGGKANSEILKKTEKSETDQNFFNNQLSNGESLEVRKLCNTSGEVVASGFRNNLPDGDVIWRTEVVVRFLGDGITHPLARIRTQCIPREGLPRLHTPQRPHFIKSWLNDGLGSEDGFLRVQDRPHLLSDADGPELVRSIVKGEATEHLPVILVRPGRNGEPPIQRNMLRNLALHELGGYAHLVVEPSFSFSRGLSRDIGFEPRPSGDILVCIPGRGLLQHLPTDSNQNEISGFVRTLRSQMASPNGWTWAQLQDAHSRQQRQSMQKREPDADIRPLWGEELRIKDERILELEHQISELQTDPPPDFDVFH